MSASSLPPPASGLPKNRPAVFLDRDGTLNVPVIRHGLPYPPTSVAELRLFDGVVEACQSLFLAGYVLVVATNQPDVGRGTMKQSVVEDIHAYLLALIPEIARIEVCYAPGQGEPDPADYRRKPEPGMLFDAAAALGLDLSRSWMIGDRWRDIDCGRRAGVKTIFIDLGYTEHLRQPPDHIVSSFTNAAAIILAAGRR